MTARIKRLVAAKQLVHGAPVAALRGVQQRAQVKRGTATRAREVAMSAHDEHGDRDFRKAPRAAPGVGRAGWRSPAAGEASAPGRVTDLATDAEARLVGRVFRVRSDALEQRAPAGWQTPVRELAALLASGWQRLQIAHCIRRR